MSAVNTITVPAFEASVVDHGDGYYGDGNYGTTREGWAAIAGDLNVGIARRKQAAAIVAWIDANPQPITLEHREGEYVHLRDRQGIDDLYQYADGEWWFLISLPDAFPRSREGMTSRLGLREVISHGFLAPGTITKATPPEPTTYGYVGTVVAENGDEWDVERYKGHSGLTRYCATRRTDGEYISPDWSDVPALGTFEAVVR